MDNQHRLQLANRMHLQLLRVLGRGIDVKRMLEDPRYARDVLLVCDALPEHGLDELSASFREADPVDAVSRPMSWAQDTSGFGISAPPDFTDVDIDLDEFSSATPPQPGRPSPWRKAVRWLGR